MSQLSQPSTAIDVDLYCQRIGYTGVRNASISTLQALLHLHTEAIGFENIDSLLGNKVSLNLPELHNKLLQEGRGGYCFEHNTLLWNVLQQLGFVVSGLASRVRWNVPDNISTPIGHMMLNVSIDNTDYLVDAGFGGLTITTPIQLDTDAIQTTTHEPFRLTRSGDDYCLYARLGDDWKPLYQFDRRPFQPVDYEVWNWFTCTAPASPFTHNLMAARPVKRGRHTLLNNRYTWHALSGETSVRYLQCCCELHAVLTEAFNIRLPKTAELDAKLCQLAALPVPAGA